MFVFAIDFSKKSWGNTHAEWQTRIQNLKKNKLQMLNVCLKTTFLKISQIFGGNAQNLKS